MKRKLFFAGVFVLTISSKAQDYSRVKDLLILAQYQKAKEELDKAMNNATYTSKPEAFIQKASVYATLAMEKLKGTSEGRKMLVDADAAFKKYRSMEPSMTLFMDPIYQNSSIYIYSGFYTIGYDDYVAKKWESGFNNLQKAMEYSDFLIEKKLVSAPIDTNVLILVGVTAENSQHPDEAAKAYSRLADRKIKGEGYEPVYRYLVIYHFRRKNYTAFEKYRAIGKELYPTSEYFTYDKFDFAVGLETSFQGKLKAIEELLAADPDNYKGNEVLGEIIYDTLNPKDPKVPLPPNADELEQKMLAAFKKSAAAKPKYENPYLYMGDHHINKAVKVDAERVKVAKEISEHTRAGRDPSKEDLAKKESLDKKYGDALELARDPYEKAAAIYAAKSSLNQADKLQYKKAVGYLSDIFSFKKIMAKNNAEDAAKYAELQNKWNGVYESIK